MRRVSLTSAALLAVSLMPGAATAEDTVKIALIMPYSGPFAARAAQMDDGIKLYMKQHGDTVGGIKIEFVRKDTGGIAPDVAKRLAQDAIVNDHADILAGFMFTPNTLAAADVSKETKKLMVVMNAPNAFITARSPYIVRTSFTVPQLNQTLGSWAAKAGMKRTYTMVIDSGPGIEAEGAFQNGFVAAGGEIVGSVRIPANDPDFSVPVQQAVALNPQSIFVMISGGNQLSAFAKVLKGIEPLKTVVMGQMEITDENALAILGDTALGMITSGNYDYNLTSSMNGAFVAAYNDEFKRNPDFLSVGGYDGMHLIEAALEKSGGKNDGDSLVNAVKGMNWESPRGPMSIDPITRDVLQTVYIRKVEQVGSHLINVMIDKVMSKGECPACPKSGACPEAISADVSKCNNCPKSGACPQ
jgi:branched-chain amino acid transport system substrate-binding protein